MSFAPAPRLVPGYRLDRYELLCPIAEGGMAQVWVARLRGKHGFEKLVAIKTILPKYASDPQFQRMFLDEARIAAGIRHANVAQILDLGDQEGILYIAMEWVDGDALNRLFRAATKGGATMPIGVILRVLADTCGGLHAAHELRGKDGALLGVVHRDVSPHNVLVDGQGAVKLIDFGIAKARDRSSGDTSTGTLKGKVQYMAPEQAIGAPVDRRADVWGVGAVLYHYLAGRPPFDGANQIATLHALTQGIPAPPLPTTIPEAVTAIVWRALSHAQDRRFATAKELQVALEDAMRTTGLTAGEEEVAAFTQRHLAGPAAQRRAAIERALAVAAERDEGSGAGSVRVSWPAPDDRPHATGSVGTAGALGVESPAPSPRSLRPRRAVAAIAGVLAVAAVVAASLSFRGRTSAAPAETRAAAPSTLADVPGLPPAPAVSAAAVPATTAPGGEVPGQSAVSPDASPSAGAPFAPAASGTASPSPPARLVPRRAPPRTARPDPAHIPKVIDNGF